MDVGLYRSFYTETLLAFTGLRPSYREDRVCRPARLVWGGEEGDKRGMKGGGRERRWGSRVTRTDAEPAQNVV